jgi:hypothetical protein
MSACQGLGLLALVMVSGIIIGFVLGWCANPSDDHG